MALLPFCPHYRPFQLVVSRKVTQAIETIAGRRSGAAVDLGGGYY
jgi:hypothetical protein